MKNLSSLFAVLSLPLAAVLYGGEPEATARAGGETAPGMSVILSMRDASILDIELRNEGDKTLDVYKRASVTVLKTRFRFCLSDTRGKALYDNCAIVCITPNSATVEYGYLLPGETIRYAFRLEDIIPAEILKAPCEGVRVLYVEYEHNPYISPRDRSYRDRLIPGRASQAIILKKTGCFPQLRFHSHKGVIAEDPPWK